MPKLLVIEDDLRVAAELKQMMLERGWVVEMAHTGADAHQLLRNFSYDMILLDWNLPDASGPEICRTFRASGGQTPIIFLTARHEEEDKETGLDAGGDDYLTKPFSSRELLARIRSVQRRPASLAPTSLGAQGLKLDAKLLTAVYQDQSVKLSRTESNILEYLMKHQDTFFTAGQILKALWPSDSSTEENTVRVHLKYLRDKLSRIGAQHIVQNVPGSGYIVRSAPTP